MKIYENNFSNPDQKIVGYIEIFNQEGLDLIIWQHGNGSVDGRGRGGAGSKSGLEYYAGLSSQPPQIVENNKLPVDSKKYNWAFPQSANGGLEGLDQKAFIEYCKVKYKANKVVLMGHSMGGGKTWKLLDSENANLVDVYVPSAGAYDAREPFNQNNLPVWAFAGENDTAFFPKTMFNAGFSVNDRYKFMNIYKAKKPLQENLFIEEGNLRLTVYKGAGHGIVSKVLNETDLWKWIDEKLGGSVVVEPQPPKEIDYSFLQELEIDQLQLLSTFSSKISESNQLTIEIEKELENKADKLLAYVMTKINSQLTYSPQKL